MKRKSSKFLSLLLAAVLLLSLIAPAALAAGTTDTIYLRTAEDLAGFSRNCTGMNQQHPSLFIFRSRALKWVLM